MHAYKMAKEEVVSVLSKACREAGYEVEPGRIDRTLSEPKPEFGDLASSIAFELGKEQKKNPKEIAEKIAHGIRGGTFISGTKVLGPYINFTFSQKYISEALSEIGKQGESYGKGERNGKKVMVEFPAVNPNKPWHVGHLRNALLGDSVARVLQFSGYDVERIDYIDDLGLQVAQSVWAYLHLDSKIEGKADQWLGLQYVEAAKRTGGGKEAEEVREIVKELEHGEGETAKIGRELCEKCVKAQYQTAYALGIYHDALIWESDIVRTKLLDAALKMMLKGGGVVKETEGEMRGCVVAKLAGEEGFEKLQNPDKVLVRSDGTATYTAKDIAFHMWKFGLVDSPFMYSSFEKQPNGAELYSTSAKGKAMGFGKADVVVNLIGVEQKYPQKVLNTILGTMGYKKQAGMHIHLAYEHAALPEGKFSGRQGTWVGYSADDVITEAEKRAYDEIREKFKDMEEEEKRNVARMVGLGAVRFSFIRTTPEKRLVFKWEEALNFDGDSAPYVQYSHARASRILEKAGGMGQGNPDYALLKETDEVALAKLLAKFPEVVERSAKEFRPHYVAEYSLEVATAFSRFYNTTPVLKAEGKERDSRLWLVKASKAVLEKSLNLIGIEAPERM